MRDIWFAVVALLGLVGPLPAAAQAPEKPSAPAAQRNPLALTPEDRILGNPDAPITIVEYASLTCPHCGHFATDVLPKLKAEWIDTGKAKLVLRDYPLDEPALRAAMIARCAPPAKFYAFTDTFFGAQQQWVLAKDYAAALQRLALLGGMSKAQFETCLKDKSAEDAVLQSRLVATQQLSVDSTPTFFINGTKFDGEPTVEAFETALNGAAKS